MCQYHKGLDSYFVDYLLYIDTLLWVCRKCELKQEETKKEGAKSDDSYGEQHLTADEREVMGSQRAWAEARQEAENKDASPSKMSW